MNFDLIETACPHRCHPGEVTGGNRKWPVKAGPSIRNRGRGQAAGRAASTVQGRGQRRG